MVAAVDLAMAILAGAADDARALCGMCERLRNSARCCAWQLWQVSEMLGLRSRPLAEKRAIALWQSEQASLLVSWIEPAQCSRSPPLWQVMHTAFCTSTGVPHSRVK